MAVEREIFKDGGDVSVLRLSKVISPRFPLFVDWANQLSKNQEIFPFNDKVFAPVGERLVVDTILKIAERKAAGLFHLSSECEILYSQAANKIASLTGAPLNLVKPVTSRDLGYQVEKYAALDTDSLKSLDIVAPSPFDVFDGIDFGYSYLL